MRRVLFGICCLIASSLGTGCSHKEDAHEEGPPKFVGVVRGPDGKEKDDKWDLSNADDKKRFQEELPHIEELKKDVKPEIIPKKFDLGLWSIIVFLVLLGVLTKFAWKPMLEGLQKREQNIRGALEQAEATRREAMELQTKLDAKMKDAGADIARMMDDGRRDAQAVKDQLVADAKKEIQSDRDRLLREVETAKDQALQEIWRQSVTLATAISSKTIRRNLTQEDHQRLVDEALAELKASSDAKRSA